MILHINIAGGVMMVLIGALMVSGLWTTLLYAIQPLIGGTVLPI